MKKVLVVDDEMDMRTFVTTLLETNGYKALSASDGEEGLEQTRKNRPSLIILDVMMPKMGGIKMYHELKKDPETALIANKALTRNEKNGYGKQQTHLFRSISDII